MPKPRQPLNTQQTEILLILYKFRFATKDLIVQYLQLDSASYTQVRIKNLLDQGYIGRHYSGQDKLAGKPAIYYLDSKGIRFLRQPDIITRYQLSSKVLNLCYKDKQAKEDFITESLTIFQLYLTYVDRYGDDMDFYTRSELSEYDYFIRPKPAAYITFQGKHTDEPDCFVDYMSGSKSYFIHRRRINQYVKQFQNRSWQKATGTGSYPTVLLITDTVNLAKRLERSVAFVLRSREIRELEVRCATISE